VPQGTPAGTATPEPLMSDCFIKLDQIPGEATDSDQELAGAIEVTSWQWGADWSGELRSKGAKGGPGDVRHFRFSHKVDSATPGLMSRCLGGQIVPKAVLTMRRAGGKAQKYLRVQFDKVRIVKIDLVHAAADQLPDEQVTIAFKEVIVRYMPQGGEGADKGGPMVFNWIVDDGDR
jgi:type VI secretion system secreted protein Hcp